MNGNLGPWLILTAIVALTLVWKGYIKLPTFVRQSAPAKVFDVVKDIGKLGVDVASLTSHELGVLMAAAARKEAEIEHAHQIAKGVSDNLKATFTAPFSPADPTKPGT